MMDLLDDARRAARAWLGDLDSIDAPLAASADHAEIFIRTAVLYAETGNPLFGWDAWLRRDLLDRPPSWLFEFVDAIGCGLLGLARHESPETAKNGIGATLGLAGAGRAGNAFREFRRLEERAVIASDKEVWGEKPYLAWERAAQCWQLSPSTARRWIEEAKTCWRRQAEYVARYRAALRRLEESPSRPNFQKPTPVSETSTP